MNHSTECNAKNTIRTQLDPKVLRECFSVVKEQQFKPDNTIVKKIINKPQRTLFNINEPHLITAVGAYIKVK